ncbi:MAG TPA: saccharopine dehydrogenase NADP-binding domain-containing protein [Burkholderiales bacterium]|nr:saccharopine dehydrogenase NADP-binding domain-containing protein [Burkholderiales bacterium]
MSRRWMIYGANGYTGTLAARFAKDRNLSPVLAGRHAKHIRPVAQELGFESRVFDLADPAVVAKNLQGFAAVLHCAGPFSATSGPMLAGCLQTGTHYLDITGEIAVFEKIHSRHKELADAGIVAIPGVGFDVVPTDCLAAMLKHELPSATHLKLAFKSRYGKLSPGTAKTMVEGLPEGGRIRKDGRIVKVPAAYNVELIPFTGDLSATAVTIPWGDVVTAYYSTGIPNIEVLVGVPEKQISKMKMPGFMRWFLGLAPMQAFMKAQIARRVKGPTDEQRARDEMYVYGEAWDVAGHKVALRLRTREAYTLTAESGVKATQKVVEGHLAPGAYTPSMAFGADYVLELEGTRLSRVKS